MRAILLPLLLALCLVPRSASAIVDLDGDGWSDLWQLTYGRGFAKDADDDGDGRTNWEEHNDGTDPLDPASRHPEPTHQLLPRGLHRFTWPSVAGKYYQLEVSFDGTSWAAIGAPVIGTGETIERTLNQSTTFLGTGPTLSRYTGLNNTDGVNNLREAIAKRVAPAEESLVPAVEAVQTVPNLDHFGQSLHGWLIPPATGEYIFWVSGDDSTEFSLSTNSTPQKRKVLAYNATWTPFHTWNWYPSQQSAPVALKAGQIYYFEVLDQEIGGGDQVSLAWTGPGLNADKEVIAGAYAASSTETLGRKLARFPSPAWRLTVTDRDSDNDGLSDYEELIAGLDPQNPKSVSRTPDLATVTAMFAAPNVVTIGAETAHAYEAEQQPARFILFRSGNLNPLVAHFTLSGTAQTGADYGAVSGSVSFGVGQNSATVEVMPVNDGQFEQAETVTASVTPDAAYDVGTPGSATVTIDDAAELVFVSTMRPADVKSGGYGSAALHLAGNRAFADLAVSFGNLTSPVTGVELVWMRRGALPVSVLALPATPVPAYRWDLVGLNGVSKDQIVTALLAGELGARVLTQRYPAGEIIAPFLRNWGWQKMPLPARPGAALTRARTDGDAARFLTQATYGPTVADIALVRRLGYAGWLEAQFRQPATRHLAYVQARRTELLARSQGSDDGYQTPRQEAWWQAALAAPDQLRQRMAFALSEILVVSDVGVLEGSHEGLANWYDLLGKHAFGNFRDLLEDVTLSPMMGQYLSMARNQKPNPETNSEPDENYAREVMQLFTIGLNMLNRDGSLALDAQGLPVPTYRQSDIVGLAHVFTGWGPFFDSAKPPDNRTSFYRYGTMPQLQPMIYYPEFHDRKAKNIVHGTTIPAGLDGPAELKLALDALFKHPNVGPFLARQLIQRFVTSNPSRGYIYRVASAFENNGQGRRGDLKATLRAVLLDPEARNPVFQESESYGKLREPLLRVTALLRAFRPAPPAAPDPRFFLDNQYNLPFQGPLKSPSVFNFFQPGYIPPGPLASAGLFAPEFQITQEPTAVTLSNFVHQTIQYGIYTRERDAQNDAVYFKPSFDAQLATLSRTDRTAEQNQAALLAELNTLLLGGRLSEGLAASVRDAWAALPSWFDQSPDRQRDRVRMAVYIITAAPEFAVQK